MAIGEALRRRTLSRPARPMNDKAADGLPFPPSKSSEAGDSTPSFSQSSETGAGHRLRARLLRFNSLVSPTHLRTSSVASAKPSVATQKTASESTDSEEPPKQEPINAGTPRPSVPQRMSSLRATGKGESSPLKEAPADKPRKDENKYPPAVSRTRRISHAVGAAMRSATAHRQASSIKDDKAESKKSTEESKTNEDSAKGDDIEATKEQAPKVKEVLAEKTPIAKEPTLELPSAPPQTSKEVKSEPIPQEGAVAFPSKEVNFGSAGGEPQATAISSPEPEPESKPGLESEPVDTGASLVEEPSKVEAAPKAGEEAGVEESHEPAKEGEAEAQAAARRTSDSISGRPGHKSIASKTCTPRHSLMAPLQVDLEAAPANPALQSASPTVAVATHNGVEGVFTAAPTAGAVDSAAAAVARAEKRQSRRSSLASSTDAAYLTPKTTVFKATSAHASPRAESATLPVHPGDLTDPSVEQAAPQDARSATATDNVRREPERPTTSPPGSPVAPSTPTSAHKISSKQHKKHSSRFSFFTWGYTPAKEVESGEVQVGEKTVPYAVHGGKTDKKPILYVGHDLKTDEETVPAPLQAIVDAEQIEEQVILVSASGGKLEPKDLEALRVHLDLPGYGVLTASGREAGVVVGYAASDPNAVEEVVVYDVDLGQPGKNELEALSLLHPDVWGELKIALGQPINKDGQISKDEYEAVVRSAAETFAQSPTEEAPDALLPAAKAWNAFLRAQGYTVDSSDELASAKLTSSAALVALAEAVALPSTVPITAVQARYDTVCTPLTLLSGPAKVVLVPATRASEAVSKTFTTTLLDILSTPHTTQTSESGPAPTSTEATPAAE